MAKNIIIESWMTSKLGLSGNSLILFAIMWRDSKQGEDVAKDDYLNHSAAMGVSVPTYYNAVKKLVENDIICKAEDGTGFCIKARKQAA